MQAKIDIKTSTYIYIVLLLFLIPVKWVLAWVLAVAFHELCHFLAVKICDGEVYNITIGPGGARMECSPMVSSKNLFAVLCGPIGGLLPLFIARWIPRFALCSWGLSVYNLLPLLHLDGGRALEILLGTKAAVIQKCFLIVLTLCVIYVSIILHFGVLPLGILVILWLKNRNTPCKRSACKLQ